MESMAAVIIIFSFLTFIMLILAVLLLCLAIYHLKLGVPFVVSKDKLMEIIITEEPPADGKTFYDLGSGDGWVLFYLAKKYPKIQFIGYELNPVLYIFARLFRRRPNLKFYRKNFFQVNLKDADYLYLYLYPELMEKLFPKLKNELKPGAVIFSNSFTFGDQINPEKVFSSDRPLETLYIYRV